MKSIIFVLSLVSCNSLFAFDIIPVSDISIRYGFWGTELDIISNSDRLLLIRPSGFSYGLNLKESKISISSRDPLGDWSCVKNKSKCLSIVRDMLEVVSKAQNRMIIPKDLKKYDLDMQKITNATKTLLEFKRSLL